MPHRTLGCSGPQVIGPGARPVGNGMGAGGEAASIRFGRRHASAAAERRGLARFQGERVGCCGAAAAERSRIGARRRAAPQD